MNYISVNLHRKVATIWHPEPSIQDKPVVPQEPLSSRQKASLALRRISLTLMAAGLLLAILTYGPKAYALIDNRLGNEWVQVLKRPGKSFGETLVDSGDKTPEKAYQPVFDATLSPANTLVIEKIGVKAPIGEDVEANLEATLRNGTWRVPEFGTPFSRKYPTILAAHRFGYLEWSNSYRRERSFYNLPKLENGDRVEIIWNQRKYVYEIIDGNEGEEITNYQADLILYTCKFLDSKLRIFRYAKLIEV